MMRADWIEGKTIKKIKYGKIDDPEYANVCYIVEWILFTDGSSLIFSAIEGEGYVEPTVDYVRK